VVKPQKFNGNTYFFLGQEKLGNLNCVVKPQAKCGKKLIPSQLFQHIYDLLK
jgi:hypothetical protein